MISTCKKIIPAFFILLYHQSWGQEFRFVSRTEEEGLPQNYVYAVSQDSLGQLMLSTGGGFAYFNGSEFTTLSSKNGLAEDFVTTHFVDSRHNLWLGHFQNGLTLIKKDSVLKIAGSESFESRVTCITEDAQQRVWIVVQGKGLYFIDSLLKLRSAAFSISINPNCIYFNNEGLMCVGTDNGVSVYNVKSPEKPELISELIEVKGNNITQLLAGDSQGNLLWCVASGVGIFGLQKGVGFYRKSCEIDYELKSASRDISNIYVDTHSNLWVALPGDGLRKISFADTAHCDLHSVQSITARNGLPNLYVQAMFEDYEGSMWFGCLGGGLIQMPPSSFVFFNPPTIGEVRSLCIDTHGDLWVGGPGGLIQYDPGDSTHSYHYTGADGFLDDQVNVVYPDRSGNLWVGTEAHGVYLKKVGESTFASIKLRDAEDASSVTSITETQTGQIIIATDDGVYFYTPSTKNAVYVSTTEGLLHNVVRSVYCDSKSRLWFCSHRTPPYYLEGDEFVVIKDIPEMNSFNINAVIEDKDGNIWIATEGDGVFRYNDEGINNYRIQAGLFSNYCYSITCSEDNQIWIGHKGGLTKINTANQQLTSYSKDDGLIYSQFNLNSAWPGVNNTVWFGTNQGIVKSISSTQDQTLPPVRTSIEQLKINGIKFSAGDSPDLKYDKYSVRVDFSGISLIEPENVVYKYRLLGLDSTWLFTSESFVEFPHIRDGDYTFQVTSSRGDDRWGEQPASISFVIQPPFWKRVWFWCFGIGLITLVIILGVRYRTRALVNAKRKLERKVTEKTLLLNQEKRQLKNMAVMLEEKNNDITDSINYAKRIQEALLPKKARLLTSFPGSFVYYKPRDIVSGDFYWFSETKDSYVIACLDCTGHGIPGAFMSLIGSTVLNEVINNKGVNDPAEILTKVDSEIVVALNQDATEHSSRDGMDAALISISNDRKHVVFASAGRPFVLLRNGEILEHRSSSFSIGGKHEGVVKQFSNITIDVEPGDMIYLFTDGYGDQFDSANRKKFSNKRLRGLFKEIAGYDEIRQYTEIENVHMEWRGDVRQLDDVTIVGIRI